MSYEVNMARFAIIFLALTRSCQGAIMQCQVGNRYITTFATKDTTTRTSCQITSPYCASIYGKASAFNGMFSTEGTYSIGYCTDSCDSFSCNTASAVEKWKELQASVIGTVISSFTKVTCDFSCKRTTTSGILMTPAGGTTSTTTPTTTTTTTTSTTRTTTPTTTTSTTTPTTTTSTTRTTTPTTTKSTTRTTTPTSTTTPTTTTRTTTPTTTTSSTTPTSTTRTTTSTSTTTPTTMTSTTRTTPTSTSTTTSTTSTSSTTKTKELPKPVAPREESTVSKKTCFIPVICGVNNEPNWVHVSTQDHWTGTCNKEIQELNQKLVELRDGKLADLKKHFSY